MSRSSRGNCNNTQSFTTTTITTNNIMIIIIKTIIILIIISSVHHDPPSPLSSSSFRMVNSLPLEFPSIFYFNSPTSTTTKPPPTSTQSDLDDSNSELFFPSLADTFVFRPMVEWNNKVAKIAGKLPGMLGINFAK